MGISLYYRNDELGIWLYHGDNIEVMHNIRHYVDIKPEVDYIITDPPYGIRKEGLDWDEEFPLLWYPVALDLLKAEGLAFVMVGSAQPLRHCINLMGETYLQTFAAWITNGMTRNVLSFGNWIPVVVGSKQAKPKWRQIQDVIPVVVDTNTEKIAHPSPKPLDLMKKLIVKVTQPGDMILDPFLGSGSTAVACALHGRRCIGIEREEEYLAEAVERIERHTAQTRMF